MRIQVRGLVAALSRKLKDFASGSPRGRTGGGPKRSLGTTARWGGRGSKLKTGRDIKGSLRVATYYRTPVMWDVRVV